MFSSTWGNNNNKCLCPLNTVRNRKTEDAIEMGDSISIPQKTRYAVTTVSFIVLFLLSLFLFSRRTLEPSVSIYQQSFPLIKSRVEPPNSSTHQAVGIPPSVFAADELDPPSNATSSDDQQPQLSVLPELQRAADSGADNDGADKGVVNDGADKGAVNDGADKGDYDNGEEKREMCDLYAGTWVRDEEYPIYKPGSCPYVDEAFDCQSNGRHDSEYMRWRWKPDGCDLPRFNATDFLERLRGKRLMLVGDSMNRNQFESILCLLREGLTNKSKMYEINGHKITKGRGYFVFKFEDYSCTVAFVRSHFLVKEGVRINAQGNSNPILSIDKIDKSSGRWKRADILIFNTGHWWVHGKTARGINYYKEGDYIYPKFDAVEAYRRALTTWAKWIKKNFKPGKQLVFYRGYSSAHFRGGDWNSGGSCNGETEPILTGPFLETYPLKMKIVEEVIQETKVPVILLNVTRLTNFRKDGHPSIYGKRLTEGKKISAKRQDCSHWCLPGVPDAWNELIYAALFFNKQFQRG